MAPVFSPQMGAGQAFNNQFLQHGGPRGPSVPSSMNPAAVGGLLGPSGLNPTRATGMAPLYAGQRLPQHGYPGPPQAQPLPRQGVKRAYSSEVSVRTTLVPVAPRAAAGAAIHGREAATPDGVGTASSLGADFPNSRCPSTVPFLSLRFTLGSSTCQEASTHLALGSLPPLPPTLGTGCPCSRAWPRPCLPLALQDCTTR